PCLMQQQDRAEVRVGAAELGFELPDVDVSRVHATAVPRRSELAHRGTPDGAAEYGLRRSAHRRVGQEITAQPTHAPSTTREAARAARALELGEHLAIEQRVDDGDVVAVGN